MTDEPDWQRDRIGAANAFFGPLVPGMLGVRFTQDTGDAIVGQIHVTKPLIAGTGFLFAPAVIALADTLCAVGIGAHLREGESFTTVEIKTNFLGSAREGETIEGRASPRHVGRTTHVWDCEVTNLDSGRTIALFRCTQMVLASRA
jgi:1,4-dihydroxy-2-naphthoyl-CoA hydrolase